MFIVYAHISLFLDHKVMNLDNNLMVYSKYDIRMINNCLILHNIFYIN